MGGLLELVGKKRGLTEAKRSRKRCASLSAKLPGGHLSQQHCPRGAELCRGDDQRSAASSGRNDIKPTTARDSIALRTPVTKPHAMEQRPLPDPANYTDPSRSVTADLTDGGFKWLVC